jgi:hypothetical protein
MKNYSYITVGLLQYKTTTKKRYKLIKTEKNLVGMNIFSAAFPVKREYLLINQDQENGFQTL